METFRITEAQGHATDRSVGSSRIGWHRPVANAISEVE